MDVGIYIHTHTHIYIYISINDISTNRKSINRLINNKI